MAQATGTAMEDAQILLLSPLAVRSPRNFAPVILPTSGRVPDRRLKVNGVRAQSNSFVSYEHEIRELR